MGQEIKKFRLPAGKRNQSLALQGDLNFTMSAAYSDGTTVSYREGKGFRVYTDVIVNSECEQIFNSVTLEICFFIFGSEARNLITRFGMDITKLISDPDLRRRYGISNDNIRRNGNPRDSKVLKKSGKTQLYVSPVIRDKIRRNKRIFDIMKMMHGSQSLAFTSGLEHVIYKPCKTEESLPILDCKIFQPFGAMDSIENPFHYTCLVCVSTTSGFHSDLSPSGSEESNENSGDENSKTTSSDDDAAIWLLEGFDAHYDEILKIIAPTGPCPIAKQKKNIEVSLLENFNLRGVNDELRKIHNSKFSINTALQSFTGGQKKRSFSGNEMSPPFMPLRWTKIQMKSGDVLVFDCRIPYMTGRNQHSMPVMYIPVSLRPVSKNWYGSGKHRELIAAVTEGKAGNWARRIAKSCNLEEFTWRTHQKDLPGCSINAAIDISTFDPQDELIFGLVRYPGY